ncbi:MAG: hypothetical protein EAZ66_07395 [Alphaproteobacteria bacterium]|nr:MAG: hypothetical protein EAZ66_07395 [Alphaproteobacteria bacterium]
MYLHCSSNRVSYLLHQVKTHEQSLDQRKAAEAVEIAERPSAEPRGQQNWNKKSIFATTAEHRAQPKRHEEDPRLQELEKQHHKPKIKRQHLRRHKRLL